MRRRNFLSGLVALPVGLKARFLALKTRFFGATQTDIIVSGTKVILPKGTKLMFPNGEVFDLVGIGPECREKAIEELRELWANLPNAPPTQ